MIDEIKRRLNLFSKKGKLKKSNVRIHSKSNIDLRNCTFEGDNYVGDRTVLRNCSLGRQSYVADQTTLMNTKIGRYCSISSRVRIVAGRHPARDFVSTHPAFFSENPITGVSYVDKSRFEEVKYADKDNGYYVTIGNDVWIGDGVAIFDGVNIADGTIVAAGAVVTKSTEPYSIVGGIPAKVIRYRFDKDSIEYLGKLKWWDKDESWIKENASKFIEISLLK